MVWRQGKARQGMAFTHEREDSTNMTADMNHGLLVLVLVLVLVLLLLLQDHVHTCRRWCCTRDVERDHSAASHVHVASTNTNRSLFRLARPVRRVIHLGFRPSIRIEQLMANALERP
jgi:hypothetical protein